MHSNTPPSKNPEKLSRYNSIPRAQRLYLMTKFGPAHQLGNGRMQVSVAQEWRHLCNDRSTEFEHRLVWAEARGPIPPKYHVHHADEDPTNNDLNNLSLLTAAEHISHHKRENMRSHRADGTRFCLGCKIFHPLSEFAQNGYSKVGTKTFKPRCRTWLKQAAKS